MKAKVTEIFQSIQGEGKYTASRQVFVRFLGCNIRCRWCDTPGAIEEAGALYKEYSVEEILKEIDALWDGCHSVSLTGGEPLLQWEFLKLLLPRLKEEGKTTYLETSGICYRELERVIENIDIVSMDFKLPSSTDCQPYWKEHERFLKIAQTKEVFVKAVISTDTVQGDIVTAVELLARINPETLFVLQPNYPERESGAMERCLDFQRYSQEYLKNVKVMSQMHKEWKVR